MNDIAAIYVNATVNWESAEASQKLNFLESQLPIVKERLAGRLRWVNEQLEGRQFLMGDTFTVADCYLFTVTGWCGYVGVDISGLANLNAYRERVGARLAVQAAMRAEGLIK